jgi:hypothetical protein
MLYIDYLILKVDVNGFDSSNRFQILLNRINPRAAGGIRAVIQFDFSGDVEGSCHFKVEDNKIASFPRAAE